MKLTIEMPEIQQCAATICAYNIDGTCHARAITVGNQNRHICDTALLSKEHTHRSGGAGVGACRSTNCAFNDDFECQADGIRIILSGGEAICGTFVARES